MGKTLSLLAHPTEGRAAPQIKIQEVNLRTKSEKKIIINGLKLASVMKIKGANNNKIISNNPASNELKFGIQVAADALFQSLKLLLESKKILLDSRQLFLYCEFACLSGSLSGGCFSPLRRRHMNIIVQAICQTPLKNFCNGVFSQNCVKLSEKTI